MCLLYICLILKPVEGPVLVLTGLNWFLGGFLKFKNIKKLRQPCLGPWKDWDHCPVFIQFIAVWSLVFYWSLRLDFETLCMIQPVLYWRGKKREKEIVTFNCMHKKKDSYMPCVAMATNNKYFVPLRLENHTFVIHLCKIFCTPVVGKSYLRHPLM